MKKEQYEDKKKKTKSDNPTHRFKNLFSHS